MIMNPGAYARLVRHPDTLRQKATYDELSFETPTMTVYATTHNFGDTFRLVIIPKGNDGVDSETLDKIVTALEEIA